MSHANDPIAAKLPEVVAEAADAARENLADATDAAVGRLGRAQHRAADLTDRVAQAAHEGARRIRDFDAAETADQVRDVARKARGRAARLVDEMRETVVEQPFKSIAIAAGVGALIALVVKSRSRS